VLRDQLTERGHRFFSTSDTEVLVKAYGEWGAGCVQRFAGMFAFAIAERDSGRLVLALLPGAGHPAFHGPFLDLVHDALNSETARDRQLFQREPVNPPRPQPGAHHTRLQRALADCPPRTLATGHREIVRVRLSRSIRDVSQAAEACSRKARARSGW
jgi:hypothetical protein